MEHEDLTGILFDVVLFDDIAYLDIETRWGIETVILYANDIDFEKDKTHMVHYSKKSCDFWVCQKYKSLRNSYEVQVPNFKAKEIEKIYEFE